jgi:hypothetical protein
MTIDAIFTVLLYSAAPYWEWLLVLVLLPVVAMVVFRRFSLRSAKRGFVFSVGIGIVSALCAPYLTGSSLSMLNGAADWVMLIMVAIGATLYSLLVTAIVLQSTSAAMRNNRTL